MKFITYLFVRSVSFLMMLIPFRLAYLISDIFFLIICYLLSYRKEVIMKNLRNAFPEKEEKELRKIRVKFYRHLADLMVEGIKGLSMTKKQVLKRHRIVNPEIPQPFFDQGTSVIGATGHYGNWEWGAFSGGVHMPHKFIAFYKPINNQYLDRYMHKRRAQFNCQLASIKETWLTFDSNRDETVVYMMVSDQSPTNIQESYWVNFLNQETACLHGLEKYARLYRLPVFYVDIQRKKRGFYELKLSLLAEDPSTLQEGELTTRFMKRLEEAIVQEPANWLWSHRRWKHKKD